MLPYNDIRAIRQLVSHTKEEFAEIYIKTLENFQKVVDQKQFEHAMILAVNALKIRRAYMLPIWTDAETCYEQKEVWTYAILIKCLLTVLPTDSKVTLTQLMSPITEKWFKRYPIIEETVKSLDEYSVLNEIIYRVQHDGNMRPKKEIVPVLSPAASSTVIEKPLPPAAEEITERFIGWVSTQLQNNAWAVNDPSAFVHRVKAGLLLQVPEIFNQFINSHHDLTVHRKLVQMYLIDQPNAAAGWIVAKDGSFIHAFYRGEWRPERTIQKGIVLDIAKFELSQQAVSTTLLPDFELSKGA